MIPVDTRAGLDGAYAEHFVDAAHLTQSGRERLARNLLAGLRQWLLARPRLRCGEASSQQGSGVPALGRQRARPASGNPG